MEAFYALKVETDLVKEKIDWVKVKKEAIRANNVKIEAQKIIRITKEALTERANKKYSIKSVKSS